MTLIESVVGRASQAHDRVPGTCALNTRDPPFLSVIVPVLNEAARIESQLESLQALRAGDAEIIVADGGSTDGTAELAAPLADRVILAPRGRASQMNAGAECARGSWLLFLHADTQLPDAAGEALVLRLRSTNVLWGRFDVAITGRHPLLPVVAWLMNRRSRLTGIATGDQAIFVRCDVFRRAGSYPDRISP